MSLQRTHLIKTPRRPESPSHAPLAGGYGDDELCGFVRPDGQVCGLFVDRHPLDPERFPHWCQPSAVGLGDRQPCLYCGVPIVKVDGEWFYDESPQMALEWAR